MFIYDEQKEKVSNIITNSETKAIFGRKSETLPIKLMAVKEEKSNVNVNNSNDNDDNKVKKRLNKRRRNTPKAIRAKFISEIENGILTRRGAAAKYGLHYEQVRRTYRRYLDNEVKDNEFNNKFKSRISDEHSKFILNLSKNNFNITLQEIQNILQERFGISVTVCAISRHLSKSKSTINKFESSETTFISTEVEEYCNNFLSICHSEDTTVIFFDEMQCKVSINEALNSVKTESTTDSSNHAKSLTILAALTKDELLFYKALEGPGHKQLQYDFLAELIDLLETLGVNNATMVMGNCASEPCDEIENLVLGAGHEVLYLPRQCESLNPLGEMFSQWKERLWTEEPVSDQRLKELISGFFGAVTVRLCRQYYKNVMHTANECLSS